jgi:hypothetical protein
MINTAYRSRKADYSLFARDYTMVAKASISPSEFLKGPPATTSRIGLAMALAPSLFLDATTPGPAPFPSLSTEFPA